MRSDVPDRSPATRSAAQRKWAFADCTLDEANRLLSVGGATVALEVKPFELLVELLRHAGEVVTKDELLDAVWPGVTVVEGSLTTAVSKLRRAIGDGAGSVIVTVPRIGYRLAAPVSVQAVESDSPELAIEPGMAVPGRLHWRFTERLGQSPQNVWRIAHDKTRATHVLKLAVDAVRLSALRREVAVARLLHQSLGDRPDFVSVLDWNFAEAPYFIESMDGGPDLVAWAAAQGGLDAVPLALRIELLAAIAATVGAAHGVGVLHKDLKPHNILVTVDRNGHWQPRVVDFGSASVLEPERLAQMGITHSAADFAGSSGGTAPWLAPELFAGRAPGVAADVYALGVLLYQLVVGDLRRPLSTGWEEQVADPLLRADIAAATAGDPDRRLDSAAELARRLRAHDQRRREAEAAAAAQARMRAAEARLALLRARRPWAIAAGLALLIGAGASGTMAVRAAQERDRALHQTRIAAMANDFLANDLLAHGDPFRSSGADERLADAVKRAEPLIDRRFGAEPAVAARLHQTIAYAFDKRSAWQDAREEYARADAMWRRAGPVGASDAIVNRLQQAMMEARAYAKGDLAHARALIDEAVGMIAVTPDPRPDVAVWLASARGMVALVGNDVKEAQRQFGEAVARSAGMTQFDPVTRLNFRQRLAFTRIRLGDGPGAERDFRALQHDFAALEGADGPNVLLMRMNLIQALMVGGKHAAAVAESAALYPRLAARLGEDHEMTMQLLLTRAESEGRLERWGDAIRDDLHVHDLAVKKLGPSAFFTIAGLVDAATAQCRGGQAAAGLASAQRAYADSAKGLGKVALTDAAAYTMAECEIDLGRPADAARHLKGIDAASVAQLAGDPDWGANVELAQARIAAAEGDRAGAVRHAEAVRRVYGAKDAEPYQARIWRALVAAK